MSLKELRKLHRPFYFTASPVSPLMSVDCVCDEERGMHFVAMKL